MAESFFSSTDGSAGDAAFRRDDIYGTSMEPTYSGAKSFMRRRYSRDLSGVDLAITGIPFDQAVSNRPGTRFGPEAVRSASSQYAWGPLWPWMFDPFDTIAAVDYGDCYFDYGAPGSAGQAIERHAREILDGGASMLSIGGDHFVTYPLLKAHAEKHGPLGFVQFDAHRDVEQDGGGRVDHGSMFGYALKEGIIDPARSVQVGIRTVYTGEHTHGMKILYADWVHANDPKTVAEEIRAQVGDGPTYMTFDIDCLDPAFAPGTGTPVPGGLSSHQAFSILRNLEGVNFIGADIVEVSPPYDHAQITALAAVGVATEYLCLLASRSGAVRETLPE